jgi:hypothetical protein
MSLRRRYRDPSAIASTATALLLATAVTNAGRQYRTRRARAGLRAAALPITIQQGGPRRRAGRS